MTVRRWKWVLVGVSLAVSACSGTSEPGRSGSSATGVAEVVGDWCGMPNDPSCSGDEALWVELRAVPGDATALTGQVCENKGRDCNALVSAAIDAHHHLTFAYTFGGGTVTIPGQVGVDSGPPQTVEDAGERVDGDFTVNGAEMTGALTSTKCQCAIPRTLYRQ